MGIKFIDLDEKNKPAADEAHEAYIDRERSKIIIGGLQDLKTKLALLSDDIDTLIAELEDDNG